MLQSEAGRANFVPRVYCHHGLRQDPGATNQSRDESPKLASQYPDDIKEQIAILANSGVKRYCTASRRRSRKFRKDVSSG